MPYIKKTDRVSLELTRHATTPGELNYLLTVTALDYLDRHKLSYKTLNEIIGAFECAKTEFQRRIVDPYETVKQHENGDLDQYAHWEKVIG